MYIKKYFENHFSTQITKSGFKFYQHCLVQIDFQNMQKINLASKINYFHEKSIDYTSPTVIYDELYVSNSTSILFGLTRPKKYADL